jgi:hypothetical protein
MPDPSSLIETLRGTSLTLSTLRKTIGASGHGAAMQDIVSLIGLVQAETQRSLARAEMAKGAGTK